MDEPAIVKKDGHGQPVFADSHCHLHLLEDDPLEVADRAFAAGVGQLLCVAVEPHDLREIMPLCESRPGVVSASVGLHPNYSSAVEPDADYLLQLADDRRVVAIGETGLDNFRTKVNAATQKERMRQHIQAAKSCSKPLIIHCRDAWNETIELLSSEKADEVGGVMHCFTGTLENAKKSIDLGFMISFSGIVTFKNAADLRLVAASIPLEMMLLETDCPYLAPEPHRGKANEPAMLVHTANKISEIKELEINEIAAQTTANYHRLFLDKSSH